MYQVTLTITEYTNHQRVSLSIWELDGNGGRRPVLHDVNIVPSLAGGLFESSWEEAFQSGVKWVNATRPETRNTDE